MSDLSYARLTRKAIDSATQGDTTALRLCIEPILPARKDRPVSFDLPRIETVTDSVKATAAIASAVADGELRPKVPMFHFTSETHKDVSLVKNAKRSMKSIMFQMFHFQVA
jgi:hypothetical protein